MAPIPPQDFPGLVPSPSTPLPPFYIAVASQFLNNLPYSLQIVPLRYQHPRLCYLCLKLPASLSRPGTGVLPDTGTHVSGACREVVSSRARGHRNDTVLVSLEHHLGVSGPWVPKLHASVLGSGHDPLVVGCQSNGKNEILEAKLVRNINRNYPSDWVTYPVAFESLNASSALGSLVDLSSSRRTELPHLDSSVQTAADKVLAAGGKCDTVNTVLVPVRSLKTLDKVASRNIPHANTLVQRSGCDKTAIRRDSNGGNAVLNGESQHTVIVIDIPQPDSAVTTAGCNGPAISREVQTVNVLLVTGERVSNGTSLDVPDSNQLVFCARSKVLAVGAEAHASDVQVTARVGTVILQDADLLARDDIVNLSRFVAARCDVFAIHAESNTAHNAFMRQSVDEVHVKHARYGRVEDKEPVVSCLLMLRWQTLDIEIAESIVGRMVRLNHPGVIRGWVCANLRGLA